MHHPSVLDRALHHRIQQRNPLRDWSPKYLGNSSVFVVDSRLSSHWFDRTRRHAPRRQKRSITLSHKSTRFPVAPIYTRGSVRTRTSLPDPRDTRSALFTRVRWSYSPVPRLARLRLYKGRTKQEMKSHHTTEEIPSHTRISSHTEEETETPAPVPSHPHVSLL